MYIFIMGKSVDTFNEVKSAWALHKDPDVVARALNITTHTVKFYLKQMNVKPPSKKEMQEIRKRRWLSVVVQKLVPGVMWFGSNKNIKGMKYEYEALEHKTDTTINPIVSQVNNKGNFIFNVDGKEANKLLLIGVDESGTIEVVYYMPRGKAPKKRMVIGRQGKPKFYQYVYINYNNDDIQKLKL